MISKYLLFVLVGCIALITAQNACYPKTYSSVIYNSIVTMNGNNFSIAIIIFLSLIMFNYLDDNETTFTEYSGGYYYDLTQNGLLITLTNIENDAEIAILTRYDQVLLISFYFFFYFVYTFS